MNILAESFEQVPTPVSNTGLFPQNFFSSSVDTLTVVFDKIATASGAYQVIDHLNAVYDECIEFDSHRECFMMRRYDGCSVSSIRGIKVHWKAPEEYGFGSLRVHIPGKALACATDAESRALMQLLFDWYGGRCTRIDVAVDDESRLTNLSDIRRAQIDGNYTGFRSHRYVTSARIGEAEGQTLYFGSPKSDAQLRIYDKKIESNGRNNSIRWELQTRRGKASEVCAQWLNDSEGSQSVIAQKLSGIVAGSIDFIDRSRKQKDLARCEPLIWWRNIKRYFGEVVSITVPKKECLLSQKIGWICQAVMPSLSAIREFMGDCEFYSFLEEGLDEKFSILSKKNREIIAQAKKELVTQIKGGVKEAMLENLVPYDKVSQVSIPGIV